MMKDFDFIGIGDTTTDAFIKLKEAEVHCNLDKTNCTISMKFGDKIPYEESVVVPAVGNSANAAVAAARLGLKSALVSNIGDDRYGKEDLGVFQKENVATDFIKINSGKKSNYHFVLLYDGERTILINHESYDYNLPDIGNPKWIYLSSLGYNSLAYHEQIADYLESHPDVKLAFQPGTFQIKAGFNELARIYKNSEIFFCNVEEAKKILNIEDSKISDRAIEVSNLLEKIRNLGPKIVVITDGVKGAYAFDGDNKYFVPNYPDPKDPVDRTGAGDSFSSTIVSSLALGATLEEALSWGPVNSMSVVQYIGAREGLLKKEDIKEYLKKAPSDYKVQKI